MSSGREATTILPSIPNGDYASDFKRKCAEAGITHSTLAFIGGGKMTTALVNGFVASGIVNGDDIAISVQSDASAWRWKKLGFENVYTCNNEMLRVHGAGIVFLAVKPQNRSSIFEQLDVLSLSQTQLVVSIMAGVDLATLEADTCARGYNQGVVRLMPNITASVGVGASVVCASSNVAQARVDLVVSLAQKVGLCVQVNEKCFNVAAAVAGCGPAFVFTMIDAIADGGVLGGLARSTALTLAAQTVMGAAKMVLESGEHPAKLKDDVCSPAGTTIYGMRELDRHGVRSAFIEAVYASTKRSEDM
uniref:pyrroline-5-carboxylate reductase n=1 Tax=Ascaris suum TaxID=6253 RepID=F1L9M4_ASCSU